MGYTSVDPIDLACQEESDFYRLVALEHFIGWNCPVITARRYETGAMN